MNDKPKADVGRTIYESNSYTVGANSAGVEITNMHTGFTKWLEGDAAADVLACVDVIPARVPADKVEAATDRYLSQYIDGTL